MEGEAKMLAALDPTLGILVVGILSALGAYLAAVRRFSGKIGSSDAAQLWLESASIREDYRARIQALEQRLSVVETQNTDLAIVNNDLVQQVRDLKDTITALRQEIVALTAELKASHQRVAELEDNADDR
jgi:peptidoglycan hydrolase CwlO-like protein